MVGAAAMYEELTAWRAVHPQASFDEIAGQVTVKRQALMGELLGVLAEQEGRGEFLAEQQCPTCGGTQINADRHPPLVWVGRLTGF